MGAAQGIGFDFFIWFGWLTLFALAQHRFCLKYPGTRSMCRTIFCATMLVALLPGVWMVCARPAGGMRSMRVLNQCFGLGVYAQTFLRSAMMLKWLAWTGARGGLGFPGVSPQPVRDERMLLASLVLLTQVVTGRKAILRAAKARPSGPAPGA